MPTPNIYTVPSTNIGTHGKYEHDCENECDSGPQNLISVNFEIWKLNK